MTEQYQAMPSARAELRWGIVGAALTGIDGMRAAGRVEVRSAEVGVALVITR